MLPVVAGIKTTDGFQQTGFTPTAANNKIPQYLLSERHIFSRRGKGKA